MTVKHKEGIRYRFQLTDDRFGKTVSVGDLSFWAMNGLVAMLDEGDGEFFVVTRREWLNRAKALNRMNRREVHIDQRDKISRTVMDMIACCKEADHQGDPLDPKVQAWYRRHKPRNAHMLLGPMPGTKAYDAHVKNRSKLILPSGVL